MAVAAFRNRYGPLLGFNSAWVVGVSLLTRISGVLTSLGTLLGVRHYFGALGLAGLATAAVSIGTIVGGAAVGALADRLGQRAALAIACPVNAGLVTAIGIVVSTGRSSPLILATSFAAGLTTPQIGALARARWILAVDSAEPPRPPQLAERLTRTAMAMEGSVDEVAFVLGPVVAAALMTVGPTAPLYGSAVLIGCGGILWSWSAPRPSRESHHIAGERPGRLASAFAVIALFVGLVIGSQQASVTAIMSYWKHPNLTGYVLSAYAIVSGLVGLMVGMLHVVNPARRLALSALVCAGVAVPIFAIPMPLLGVVDGLLISGALAPCLISVNQLVGHMLPNSRVAAATGLMAGAVVMGVGLGTALAGLASDKYGTTGAVRVTPALACGLLAIAGMVSVALRREGHRGEA